MKKYETPMANVLKVVDLLSTSGELVSHTKKENETPDVNLWNF